MVHDSPEHVRRSLWKPGSQLHSCSTVLRWAVHSGTSDSQSLLQPVDNSLLNYIHSSHVPPTHSYCTLLCCWALSCLGQVQCFRCHPASERTYPNNLVADHTLKVHSVVYQHWPTVSGGLHSPPYHQPVECTNNYHSMQEIQGLSQWKCFLSLKVPLYHPPQTHTIPV